MPKSAATIDGVPKAFAVVRAMGTDSLGWGKGYRPLCHKSLSEFIQGRDGGSVRFLA